MKREHTDKREFYLSAFRSFEESLNGEKTTPLHAIRQRAIDAVTEFGFPSGRDEDWRHTNLAHVTRTEFVPASHRGSISVDVAPLSFEDFSGIELVFINGQFCETSSSFCNLPAGVRISALASAASDDADILSAHLCQHAPYEDTPGFTALNTAFVRDGAFVHVPQNVALEMPIHVIYLSTSVGTGTAGTPSASFPRTLVVVEEGARACVAETFVGLAPDDHYLTDAVTEIVVGEKAHVDHIKLQRESAGAFHAGALYVNEAAHCSFASHNVIVSGQLVRNDVTTTLTGTGIESTLNGVFLGGGDSRIDNHTAVEHAAPGCSSHELYKGILGDTSHAVFRGKIHVHQAAQQTDAYQSNQNLLLSNDADITSKPQLEIYADDVKCSHGSTTGQLDADAIFYLRSRGIAEKDAVAILTRAFADEIVDRIPNEPVRRRIRTLVADKLASLLQETA